MIWYAIYETATGKLVSTGTVIANPLPAGLASKQYSAEPESGSLWIETLADFVPLVKVKISAIDPITGKPRTRIYTVQDTEVIIPDSKKIRLSAICVNANGTLNTTIQVADFTILFPRPSGGESLILCRVVNGVFQVSTKDSTWVNTLDFYSKESTVIDFGKVFKVIGMKLIDPPTLEVLAEWV